MNKETGYIKSETKIIGMEFTLRDGSTMFVPKKEALEEAAKNYGWTIKRNTFSDAVKANELAGSAQQDFIAGAEWQAERMYSEEDLVRFMQFIVSQESLQNTSAVSEITAKYYVDKFKDLI